MSWSVNRKLALKWLSLYLAVGGSNVAIARAQAPEPEAVVPPTVIGDWVRIDDIGVGTYANFELHQPHPSLTPAGQHMLDKFPKFSDFKDISQKVGNAYVVHPHPCGFFGGFGGLEYNSSGFHIIKSKDEVVVVGEEGGVGNARHIYLDGRPLPSPGTRSPSNTGYSVGHLEADGTLVIQTTDMTQGMVMTGPGVRSPETVVTQRYEPSKDGTKMKITYTYTDPKLYAKPFTYEYKFQRMAPNSVALEDFCDATDPLESQSVVPPKQ